MKTLQWTNIDKTSWGEGPWQHEPDKIQWQDAETGLPCLAVRHTTSGHWCGYVGVAEGHPFYGIEYSSCPEACAESWCDHRPESALEVHGGITFADFCQEHADEGHGVCHIADPGEAERVYWLGFDCAHSEDLSPAYQYLLSPTLRLTHERYRTLDYVQAQCRELARQLAALA